MNEHRDTSSSDRTTYRQSRAVRLEDFDYASDTVIHLTICAVHSAAFVDQCFAHVVCESIETTSKMLDYELYGYCLMPDHLHVLLSPASSGIAINRWLQKFKSFTGHTYGTFGGSPPLWQRSAHDHVCRSGETAEKVLGYIVENPVRAGLVEDWREWPWIGVFIDL